MPIRQTVRRRRIDRIEAVRGDLIGAQARLVIVDCRRDHQLINRGALDEGLHLRVHHARRANCRASLMLIQHLPLHWRQLILEVGIGRRQWAGSATA